MGSIVATETSTVTFISVPGFAYGLGSLTTLGARVLASLVRREKT